MLSWFRKANEHEAPNDNFLIIFRFMAGAMDSAICGTIGGPLETQGIDLKTFHYFTHFLNFNIIGER